MIVSDILIGESLLVGLPVSTSRKNRDVVQSNPGIYPQPNSAVCGLFNWWRVWYLGRVLLFWHFWSDSYWEATAVETILGIWWLFNVINTLAGTDLILCNKSKIIVVENLSWVPRAHGPSQHWMMSRWGCEGRKTIRNHTVKGCTWCEHLDLRCFRWNMFQRPNINSGRPGWKM